MSARNCEASCNTIIVGIREVWLQATSSEHKDHRRLCTPCHVELKLWYTKSTFITQQHCNSTWTPPTAWTYQLYHVDSCHESSRPHHYYGPYCSIQCNVMWKSKRATCKVEESCKSNSHEGSRIVTRVSFTLGYIHTWFVHAEDFSRWLLPHSLESL